MCKTGFSKDGKHENPQIFIGLLVGGGQCHREDIFEGNIYEGHTLIPFIQKISTKFNLDKPVVIADAGLLSNDNIKALDSMGYEYIIGGSIKNEPASIRAQILADEYADGHISGYTKETGTRLVVSYSKGSATKDAYNRKRGLKRLEKKVKTGKLTKASINNKGYNKYLKLTDELSRESIIKNLPMTTNGTG